MSQVAILCATENNNLKLAEKLQSHIKELGMEPLLVKLEDLDLPLYTPTLEGKGVPAAAKDLSAKLRASGGLVLVAPEYNGSIPPIMVNAVAWVSRSGDEDWRASFNGKIGVVATHSGGGGQKVCQAMRSQLEHLGCTVLARPVVTNFKKELNPESADAIFGQMKALIS